MKKLFALLLAVLMIATMSTTAFAATVEEEKTETITVTGTYVAGSGTPEDVISLDISWGSMAFTYTAGTEKWDPESHTYKTETAGTWTCAEDANKITIANHSNVKINVAVLFTDNTGNGIKGAFYRADGTQAGDENYMEVNLTSAASEGWLGNTSAPTDNIYFKITKGAISANSDNLGTITLTIKNLGQ